MDFGDAPDPIYPTLRASDGARHILSGGPFLGAGVDWEPDGQPSAFADGDDNDGNDDEDGVVFTSLLMPGGTAYVDLTASAPGLLDAWIDFNVDGDWADAGEQILASEALAAGVNALSFTVPAGATPTGLTFARFRFSTAGGLSFVGLANDGEVEDYAVEIGSLAFVESYHYPDSVTVSIYDVDPSNGISDPDVAWNPGEFAPGVTDVFVNPGPIGDRVINFVALYGDGSETRDLGFVVENNLSLRQFLDRRTGAPPLGFLVSKGYVGAVNLKTGIEGANLNAFTSEGGWDLPADIDGDGDPADPTGFYSDGYLGSFVARDDVQGDIVVGGHLRSLQVTGGDIDGDLVLTGSDIGSVLVRGGSIRGNIQAPGSIGRIAVFGGNVSGGVHAGGNIRVVQALGGNIEGLIDVDGNLNMAMAIIRGGAGGAINGPVDVEGDLRVLKAVGGSVTQDIDVGGNLATLIVMGGDLTGNVDVGGDFGVLRVVGGDIQGQVDVGGHLTRAMAVAVRGTGGDVAGSLTAGAGLRSLLAGGNLSGDLDVTGDLGSVTVRGSILGSAIDVRSSIFRPGGWGVLFVMGNVNGSTFGIAGGLRRALVRGHIINSAFTPGHWGLISVLGDFTNSSIDAGTLGRPGRLLVRGEISEDGSDGDTDGIHANGGRFFVKDADESAWIDIANDYWFDGVRAWVG